MINKSEGNHKGKTTRLKCPLISQIELAVNSEHSSPDLNVITNVHLDNLSIYFESRSEIPTAKLQKYIWNASTLRSTAAFQHICHKHKYYSYFNSWEKANQKKVFNEV